MAADKATPEAVNFMAKYGRGLICVPMTGERLDELEIRMMVADNTAPMGTAFTVTVDARARRDHRDLRLRPRRHHPHPRRSHHAAATTSRAPGHIFPLRAMPGGVLRRAGHTEAAVDLARLAGCYPAGVICEVLDEDGGMARVPQLVDVAQTPRPQDHHDQGPHRVPRAQGEAGAPRSPARSCPPTSASSRPSRTRRAWTAGRRSRS